MIRFKPPLFSAVAALLTGIWLFSTPVAQAGCGCEKPPPPPASVRPQVAYAGTEITLFYPDFQPGQAYTVVFTSSATGDSAMVNAKAVERRDLADKQYKPQVTASLPTLPLGPASISVYQQGQSGAVMALSDDAFTVAPLPLLIPSKIGSYRANNFQMAVSRQGVAYLTLDVTAVTNPMVFRVWADGYPLRFQGEDVVFYNSQGYLMQLLDGSIPGLFTTNSANHREESDILQYSRHEFNTFFLQHKERQTHAVDPNDPNWHADGTPHIDHDHLIVAVTGYLGGSREGKGWSNERKLLTPGATPKFKLYFDTYPLVQQPLLSEQEIEMSGKTIVKGNVVSNAIVTLKDEAVINGKASALLFDVGGKAAIKEGEILNMQLNDILPVYSPKSLVELGDINLGAEQSVTLVGPGSYRVSNITVNGGQLEVNNKQGPVTLYVTGKVDIQGKKSFKLKEKAADGFVLYIEGQGTVRLTESGEFNGIIYAPNSKVEIGGRSQVSGAVVGRVIKLKDEAQIQYDKSLNK